MFFSQPLFFRSVRQGGSRNTALAGLICSAPFAATCLDPKIGGITDRVTPLLTASSGDQGRTKDDVNG